MENERYDIAIIGTGPAGLEAAITAKVRGKKIILIGGKNLSVKVEKAHTVQNYLGLPNATGQVLQNAFQSHLDAMGIKIREGRVNAVYPMGVYFGVQSSLGMLESRAVILATGVVNAKSYSGEDALLGRGVSYCATCDGALYKGKKVAVVSFSKNEEREADFLSGLAEKVYYFPMYKDEVDVSPNIQVIREMPKSIDGKTQVESLTTDANSYDVSAVFILRDNIAAEKLVQGIEMDGNHVKVDRKMQTSVAGCFACGDITGTPYQYIKSAGEGNVAALSAVAWLDEKRTNV